MEPIPEEAAAPQRAAQPAWRRRRRWLIGALFLVVAGAATWWSWPRIDPRFVGKWKISTEEVESALGALSLDADGTGWVVVRRQQKVIRYSFPWRVEGRTLVVYGEPESRLAWITKARSFAYKHTRSPVFLGSERFAIAPASSENGSQLTRQSPASAKSLLPGAFSITRLPE